MKICRKWIKSLMKGIDFVLGVEIVERTFEQDHDT
jgi:hypothetical protein